jgi:hypothetical protein
MPNWVSHKITFPAARAEEVFAAVKSEHLAFDFTRLVPQPPNMYHGDVGRDEETDFPINFTTWNRANWGTKWNANESKCEVIGDKAVITFETAWSVCYPIIAAFINRFGVPFELRYCDEAPNFWGIETYGAKQYNPEGIVRLTRHRDRAEDREPLQREFGLWYEDDEDAA